MSEFRRSGADALEYQQNPLKNPDEQIYRLHGTSIHSKAYDRHRRHVPDMNFISLFPEKDKSLTYLIGVMAMAFLSYFIVQFFLIGFQAPWLGVGVSVVLTAWLLAYLKGGVFDLFFLWLADAPSLIYLSLKQRWRELNQSIRLFTRLPLFESPAASRLENRLIPPWHIGWTLPVVGFLIGLVVGGTVLLCSFLSIPPSVGAVAALLVSVLLTGSRQEDGLADFLDGMGGGKTREDALRIMKDSAIGSYGTLAMMFALAAKGVAIAEMSPVFAAGAIVAAHTVSRGSLILPMHWYHAAKMDDITRLGHPTPQMVAITLCLTILLTLLAQPYAPTTIIAWISGTLVITFIAWLGWRKIRGYSNDVFGAAQQFAEIAVLWSIAAFLI